MKAMILAAGLGTRLRPWTLEHPKALVPVGGVPMLRRVIDRLRTEGSGRLGVNVHHFGEQIIDYLADEPATVISDERSRLLDTGGGVVAMAPLLDPEGEGFLVHNVDILSDAPLGALWAFHQEHGAQGVTLLVSRRDSSRRLIVDEGGELRGWRNMTTGEERRPGQPGEGERLTAFSGIYAVGADAVAEMRKLYGSDPFPIMDYLLSPRRRRPVRAMEVDGLRLMDIGKPETLAKAGLGLDGVEATGG